MTSASPVLPIRQPRCCDVLVSRTRLACPGAVREGFESGPGARVLLWVNELPGCGHAPALDVPQQLEWVSGFIERC